MLFRSSSLKKNELDQFASLMKKETYTEGETLFNEGDAGDCMFIVLAGAVSINVNLADGKTLEIADPINYLTISTYFIFAWSRDEDDNPLVLCIKRKGTEAEDLARLSMESKNIEHKE